jgi:hypothetical protein
MIAYAGAHDILFAEARNLEIAASLERTERQRAIAFAATRNAEIELSMARVNGESELATLKRIVPHLLGPQGFETGSIALAAPIGRCPAY